MIGNVIIKSCKEVKTKPNMDLNNCIFEELLKAAQHKRGLFVIPLPTGSGKTYNSCLLMAEELKKEDARRIFYVTDAKKQLDATIEILGGI